MRGKERVVRGRAARDASVTEKATPIRVVAVLRTNSDRHRYSSFPRLYFANTAADMAALASYVLYSATRGSSTDLICRLLPRPVYAPTVSDDEEEQQPQPQLQSTSVVIRQAVPPYGRRRGWKPTSQSDFGELSALH